MGGAIGSFAGVVAGRGWRGAMQGRSRCDMCNRTLAPFELVPLVSYLALSGRCRTCHTAIGTGALAWEASGAAIGAATLAVVLMLVVR